MQALRKPSCNELLYMDLQDLTNSYAIQYVCRVRITGELPEIERAFETVFLQSPGVNVFYRDGYYYPCTDAFHITEMTWEGELFALPLLRDKIDYKSHSVEATLVHHSTGDYFIIRMMHSVIDGKAALVFVQNVMNVLKGAPIIPAVEGMDDNTFVKKFDYYKKNEPKLPKTRIPGTVKINHFNEKWRVVEINGYPNALVARLARILADLSPDGSGKIMIPADVRRYEPGVEYNTNLTLPLFLNVKKDESLGEINGDLLTQMRDHKELNLKNTDYYHYKSLPGWLRKAVLRTLLSYTRNSNRFAVSGLVSFLGKVKLEDFNNPCITFEEFYSLPVHQSLITISMVIVQHSKKTFVILSYFEGQFSEEKIEEIAEKIKSSLSPDLYAFNRTNKTHEDVYAAILERLKNDGQNTAVKEDEKEYSYSDLYGAVKKITRALRKSGVQNDLCLYMERGFHYLATVLACVYEGITFLPVDKTKSEKDLGIIRSCSTSGVVFTKEDAQAAISEEAEDAEITYEADPLGEVYRIFTSGTTNQPKCVPITRDNLNNYLGYLKRTFGKEKVNMPLFTSLSVDLTMTSVFLPLISGGFIRCFRENFRAETMERIAVDPDLNAVKCTPTHFSFLKDKKTYSSPDMPVKNFIVGGENLSCELAERICRFFRDKAVIYNEYGPTETTVGVTIFRFMPGAKSRECNVSIGRPIDNTRILLMKDGKAVEKENETGEILIAGKSVFAGYRGNSSECFIKVGEEAYYRSGDLGFIQNGNLYCIGRADSQVKINGNRVELNYIRNCLNQMDKVSDSVVLYEDRLFAFVISEGTTESEIREYLRKELPSYMVPAKIFFIDRIPINSSGKEDLKALKEMIPGDDILRKPLKEPESKLLMLLMNRCKEYDVDHKDNLYAVGMESVDILMFLQSVREEFLPEAKEEAFYKEVLSDAGNLTIEDIENAIVRLGGQL